MISKLTWKSIHGNRNGNIGPMLSRKMIQAGVSNMNAWNREDAHKVLAKFKLGPREWFGEDIGQLKIPGV